MEGLIYVRNNLEQDELDKKVLSLLPGKVVRKNLVTPLKGEYNVPTYVIEYLLGKYCSSGDEKVIAAGLEEVKRILTKNYVSPDQSEVLKSKIREKGSYKVIDKVKVRLVETEDRYWAELVNLQINYVNIDEIFVKRYEKLLSGGIWAVVDLGYDSEIIHKRVMRPFIIRELRPIQLAVSSFKDLEEKRSHFTTEEWVHLLVRSMGLEPTQFNYRLNLLLLLRLIPLVENNYNLVELGPRGTGKSYVYRELSPYSILVSGGETTVPSLFISHIGRGRMGLVGLWDVVAFDEVAGLTKLRDQAAVQIMKDYMESGSFSRGREEITAMASMAFLGNVPYDIEHLVRTTHLFVAFPQEMQDLAFLDRFHCYIPGWEIPKIQPEHLTKHFGFVVNYLAEFLRDARKTSHSTVIDKYYRLGSTLNKRDEKAVRKTVSALIKLVHPDGDFNKDDLEEYLSIALETRRRVKEQLKRMGGIEYWNTKFDYWDKNTQIVVEVPEMKRGAAIPDQYKQPGVVYTVGWDYSSERASLFRIEVQLMKGSGVCRTTGSTGKSMNESIKTAFDYLKAKARNLEVKKSLDEYDLHVQVVNLMGAKEGRQTGIAFLLAMVSALVEESLPPGIAVIGDMSVKGSVLPIDNIAEGIQIINEQGGRRVLLPQTAKKGLTKVPPPLLVDLDTITYVDGEDAVRKCFQLCHGSC